MIVLHMFDSICAKVVRSIAKDYDLWHELSTRAEPHTLLIAAAVGLLCDTTVRLQKNQ